VIQPRYDTTYCIFNTNPLYPLRPLLYKLIIIQKMPVNKDDFDEPDWEKILTLAFPEWEKPKAGCPRLDSLSGNITEGFTEFPVYEEGKWNPCYYTKAFAGLGEL